MKNPILLTILALLAACNTRQLKLTDLKFADFEKEAIARNRIDTMFMISKNFTLNEHESDTFGYYKYEKGGNLLADYQNVFGGHYVTYNYDNNNMVSEINQYTDYHERLDATYRFLPDSLLLYKYWKQGIDTDKVIGTRRFRFEKDGRVRELMDYGNNDKRKDRQRTVYQYDSLGRLIKITKYFSIETIEKYKILGVGPFDQEITDLLYSGNLLGSTIKTLHCQINPNRNQTTKTFYNALGLRDSTIANDTLVTYYAYKTRPS